MFEKCQCPQSQWFEELVFASAGTKMGLVKRELFCSSYFPYQVISDFPVGCQIYLLSNQSEQVFDNITYSVGVCVCERERETDRQTDRDRDRERDSLMVVHDLKCQISSPGDKKAFLSFPLILCLIHFHSKDWPSFSA